MRYTICILFLVCAGCCTTTTPPNGSKPGQVGVQPADQINYESIPIKPIPIQASKATAGAPAAGAPAAGAPAAGAPVADANGSSDYPNIDFTISLESMDAHGNINYTAIGVSAGYSDYAQIVDFKKYQVVVFPMSDGGVAFLEVGMAYRATMKFTLVSAGLNASVGLFGANVGTSNLVGNISFGLYGLRNNQALSSIPTPSAVTQEKILEYFQSLAIVKNVVLGDSTTPNVPLIDPQIIAINPNGHTLKQVMQEYYTAKAKGTKLQSGNLMFQLN